MFKKKWSEKPPFMKTARGGRMSARMMSSTMDIQESMGNGRRPVHAEHVQV